MCDTDDSIFFSETPILDNFFSILERGAINYCIVCLRTEHERLLVRPQYFTQFAQAMKIEKYWKHNYVCNYCERQAYLALRFFNATKLSAAVDTIIAELLYQRKRAVANVFSRRHFQNILWRCDVENKSATPTYYEHQLHKIRNAAEYAAREAIVVDNFGVIEVTDPKGQITQCVACTHGYKRTIIGVPDWNRRLKKRPGGQAKQADFGAQTDVAMDTMVIREPLVDERLKDPNPDITEKVIFLDDEEETPVKIRKIEPHTSFGLPHVKITPKIISENITNTPLPGPSKQIPVVSRINPLTPEIIPMSSKHYSINSPNMSLISRNTGGTGQSTANPQNIIPILQNKIIKLKRVPTATAEKLIDPEKLIPIFKTSLANIHKIPITASHTSSTIQNITIVSVPPSDRKNNQNISTTSQHNLNSQDIPSSAPISTVNRHNTIVTSLNNVNHQTLPSSTKLNPTNTQKILTTTAQNSINPQNIPIVSSSTFGNCQKNINTKNIIPTITEQKIVNPQTFPTITQNVPMIQNNSIITQNMPATINYNFLTQQNMAIVSTVVSNSSQNIGHNVSLTSQKNFNNPISSAHTSSQNITTSQTSLTTSQEITSALHHIPNPSQAIFTQPQNIVNHQNIMPTLPQITATAHNITVTSQITMSGSRIPMPSPAISCARQNIFNPQNTISTLPQMTTTVQTIPTTSQQATLANKNIPIPAIFSASAQNNIPKFPKMIINTKNILDTSENAPITHEFIPITSQQQPIKPESITITSQPPISSPVVVDMKKEQSLTIVPLETLLQTAVEVHTGLGVLMGNVSGDYSVHPITIKEGVITVPSLQAFIKDGFLVSYSGSPILLLGQEQTILKHISENIQGNAVRPPPLDVTLQLANMAANQRLNANSMATPMMKLPEEKKVDWEDKIPMGLIAFMDPTEHNPTTPQMSKILEVPKTSPQTWHHPYTI